MSNLAFVDSASTVRGWEQEHVNVSLLGGFLPDASEFSIPLVKRQKIPVSACNMADTYCGSGSNSNQENNVIVILAD